MPRKKRKLPTALHGPVYLALRSLMTGIGAMPAPVSIDAARGLARAFARAPFNRTRLARAHEHLAVAFPDWPESRRREAALHAYEHLFALAVETTLIQPRLNRDGWSRLVELGNVGPALDRLTSGEPCIMLTAHCGNWELLGSTLAMLGFPTHALYRPLDLKPLDAYVRRSRQRFGLRLVEKFGAGDDLTELMTHGGTPSFVADQNAGDKGLFVPFFGRLAASYKSIALLAQTYRAHVVVGCARRLAPAEIARPDPDLVNLRYRLEISDVFGPDDYANRPDPTFYITARYRRAFEASVRRAPEQFLWMHRYWRSRPRHEKLGKAFPPALRDKLESLPWMTTAELARVIEHSRADSAAWLARSPAPSAEPAGSESPGSAASPAPDPPGPPEPPTSHAAPAEPHAEIPAATGRAG